MTHSQKTTRKQVAIRDRARAAMRTEIAEQAIELFDQRGFDRTTVDDIAEATEISPRTFFRYFTSKEEVIFGDLLPLGEAVRDALAARPPQEPCWQALRASLDVFVELAEADIPKALRTTRVASSTPGLRARNLEKHNDWAEFLTPLAESRIDNSLDTHTAAKALVHSALACLDVALNAWAAGEGSKQLGELLDVAFEAVGNWQRP
ncbi:TetR family transcriptional regulator [Nocardia sp. NPDC059246]|uniref:TetR family transcriptional regulator n=1 Tax=unclassified Nocardia TaxID=2637762 RepID=UPI0036C85B4E